MKQLEPISNYDAPNVNSGAVDQPLPTNANNRMAWLAPVLSLVGSVGTTIANQVIASKQNEKNLEYNSPAAQMARYEAAGINPFQVVGNIQPGSSSFMPPQVEDPVNKAMNNVMSFQQLSNNMLQNDMIKERIRGLQLDNDYKSATMEDRVGIIIDKAIQAYIKSQYDQGNLTKQQYDLKIKQWQKEYADWYYNSKHDLLFYDSDAKAYGTLQRSPATMETSIAMQKNQWSAESVQQDMLGKIIRNEIFGNEKVMSEFKKSMMQLELNYMRSHGSHMGTMDSKTGLAVGAATWLLKLAGMDEETIEQILGTK